MTTEALEIAILAVRRFSETHPRPVHVSQHQASEMLNISVPTVRKLVRSGTLRLNKCGLIPISQLDALLEDPTLGVSADAISGDTLVSSIPGATFTRRILK